MDSALKSRGSEGCTIVSAQPLTSSHGPTMPRGQGDKEVGQPRAQNSPGLTYTQIGDVTHVVHRLNGTYEGGHFNEGQVKILHHLLVESQCAFHLLAHCSSVNLRY
jgi:hypothetical protein